MKQGFLARRAFFLLLLLVFSFSLSRSQDADFGKNKVQYRNFDWHYIQTTNFDLYYYTGGYDLAKFAAEVLENAYPIISKQLSYQLKKRVPIIIYQSANEFQQTNVISDLIGENVGGFTEAFKTRVVVPFDGSLEDFRHVLHHELTHALVFDMLYGNILQSLISRQALFDLPLWFSEGFAEYSSRFGMDFQGDMVLRDATINNYLAPLPYVGGFLAYKEGQSVLTYVSQRWGEEKISEILKRGRARVSIDEGLKAAIGINEKQLDEEWQVALKRMYWPEIAKRKLPKDFAKQLTFHDKDGSFYNEKPVFSPQSDKLAIFSDRSDYAEIIIISALDGKLIERLIKGERSGDLESLHSYVSGISWSPDGKSLAFISRSKGKDALFLVNVDKKKIYLKQRFENMSLQSPSFSPDGTKIVLAGTENGAQDLYLYDLGTKKLSRLTQDAYSDADPSWSPTGEEIVFSSDRPKPTQPDSAGKFVHGNYDLFTLELENKEIKPLEVGPGGNRQPAWSALGDKIAFVSNRNGIDNIYIAELDSDATYPVTNILTGCFNPSWSKEGDQLAFSAFYKGGWDIYVMKEIFPQAAAGVGLEPTLLKSGVSFANLPLVTIPPAADSTDSLSQIATVPQEHEFTSYVFHSKEKETLPETTGVVPDSTSFSDSLLAKAEPVKDTLSYRTPDGEFQRHRYRFKLTPDLVAGFVGYNQFFGFQGQSLMAFSDLMGNHNFLVYTNIYSGSLDRINGQAYYSYTARRTDYSLGALHTKYYYIDDKDRLFSDRVYGALMGVSRPFSKFSRVDLSASMVGIDREYDNDAEFAANPLPYLKDSRKALYLDISLVRDNVLWGLTGPINGGRSRLNFEYAPQTAKSGIAFRSARFDMRRYFHFLQRFNIAVRAAGGTSWGKEPRQFFLGGVSNWISADYVDTDIYTIENLYFSGIITPLRGFDLFEFSGRNFGLFNLEFRYPFIDRLDMAFPLSLSLSRVNGVLFFDAGAAWNRHKEFKGGSASGKTRLQDIHTSFGFGARANLGFLILRFDTAWATDFADVTKPRYYFSLGADF